MLVCTVRCSFPSPFQLRGPLATSVLRSGKSRADHSASPRVSPVASFAGSGALPQLFQDLIHAETSGSLARREFLERGEELADDALRAHCGLGRRPRSQCSTYLLISGFIHLLHGLLDRLLHAERVGALARRKVLETLQVRRQEL